MLRRTEVNTFSTSSAGHTSLAPADSAAIHISSSGMRWVQTMGSEGKSRCRLSTSVSRQYSMLRTTASGWFRATSSRNSSRERVTCTEKCGRRPPASDRATLGSFSRTTMLCAIFPPNLQPSSTANVNLRLGLRGGWDTTSPQTSKALDSRSEIRRLTVVQATSLSAPRMVPLEASRSSSAGFRLFLPPVPVPCGRTKKAACLLQTVSEKFPKGLLPFPVPEQFFPASGGTLQTWATGFSLRLLL